MDTNCILILADVSGMGQNYHVGDEAMAEVAIARLAETFGRDNLVLVCASPVSAAETYGIKAIPLYSRTRKQRRKAFLTQPHSVAMELAKIIYYLKKSDLVFVSGGGNHTSVWPHVLESRLFFYQLAQRFNKPIVFASQTLGPFLEEHRGLCQKAFGSAAWVGVRDRDYSASQLDVPVHFAVDDAVFLQGEHNAQTKAISVKHPNLFGLSLRGFKGATDQQRESFCISFANIARKNSAGTVFIPHHAPGRMGDLDIAQKILPLWPDDSPLEVLDPIPYATAVKALTEHCSLVVTMRYHQLVFALSAGVPAIGICVEEYTRAKLNGAFEQFGLAPRLLSLEEAPQQIEALIGDVLRSKDSFVEAAKNTIKNSLCQNMAPYRRAAEIVFSPHQ